MIDDFDGLLSKITISTAGIEHYNLLIRQLIIFFSSLPKYYSLNSSSPNQYVLWCFTTKINGYMMICL